jgi:hypothetical protein
MQIKIKNDIWMNYEMAFSMIWCRQKGVTLLFPLQYTFEGISYVFEEDFVIEMWI